MQWKTRASSPTPPIGEGARPRLQTSPAAIPASARFAAGVFWAVELVADRRTREPLAPYGSSSPAMNATIAACKTAGLLPFANFNRIHVVPPCTVSEAEARQGLAILDDALDTADAHLA